MAVIRTKRENNFTVLSNLIFAPGELSFDARGLLCTLLSKPDNWTVNIKALVNDTTGCRKQSKEDALYAIFKELKDKGYVVMKRKATGDVDYFVYDTPQISQEDDECVTQPAANDNKTPIGKIPVRENPQSGKSPLGKIPVRENPEVLIRTETTNKEISNVNNKNINTPLRKNKTSVWTESLALLKDKGVDEQVAKDFIAVRKSHKAPLTRTALGRIELEANKAGWTLEGVIRLCAEKGWRGFEAKWLLEERNHPQPHKPSVKDVPHHTEGGRLSW